MGRLILGVLVLAGVVAPAAAEMQYDRKLEQAVMAIVAGKIGDIRGGLSYDRRLELVMIHDMTTVDSLTLDRSFDVETARLKLLADAGKASFVSGKVARMISF